jgi:hypothetical protein
MSRVLYTTRSCQLLGVLLVAAPTAALAVITPSPFTNPFSSSDITVDGQYSPLGPPPTGEWADITPAWFHSDAATGATPVPAGSPLANSLLLAAVAQGTVAEPPSLYLMYDYLDRTNSFTGLPPGSHIADITFPLIVPAPGGNTQKKNITVKFQTNSTPGSPTSFFDIFVDLNDGSGLHPASAFDLEGAAGFGVTPTTIVGTGTLFSTVPHLLVELEIPLDIPAGFSNPAAGGKFDPGGQHGPDGGGYSPDPAFWGGNISNNAIDPPSSAAIFQINPDGSTLITPQFLGAPEPASLLLMALGSAALLRRRRS